MNPDGPTRRSLVAGAALAGALGPVRAEAAPSPLADLDFARVHALDQFAQAAGIALGQGDDQPAFDAAERAMAEAARSGGSLYVRIPPGRYRLRRLRLHSRCGYYADPRTAVLEQAPAPAGAALEPFVALADPFASFYLLYGLALQGGWRWARAGFGGGPGEQPAEADPWLYHPPPPGRPASEARPGQTGVALHGANSGVDDARYARASPLGAQNPRGRVGELEIAGFGGDGLSIQGAGTQVYGPIQIFRIGGRGMVLDGYDCNFTAIDIGETGLEGLLIGPNGSSSRLAPLKIWYSGGRGLADHACALRLDRCGAVQLFGELQDARGGLLEADAAQGCTLLLNMDWQGELGSMGPDVAALTLRGDVAGNALVVTVGVSIYARKAYPNVRRILRTQPGPGGERPQRNTLVLNHGGFAGDHGGWNPDWFDGPLDGNLLLVNDQIRQPGAWAPADDGAVSFGLAPSQGLRVSRDGLSLSHPAEVRLDGAARGRPLLTARPDRVALGAPLRLASYTVRTAPSPVAAGAGAAIYLVDEIGGPQGAKSDGRQWRRDSDNAVARARS